MRPELRRKVWIVSAITVLVMAFTVLWGFAIGAPHDVAVIGGVLGVLLLASFEELYVQSPSGTWLRTLKPVLAVPIYAAVLCAILFLAQHVAHFATGRTAQLSEAYGRLPMTIPLVFFIGVVAVSAYCIIGVVIAERIEAAALARELEIARQIQFAMLPDAESLAALCEPVDVEAVLEPAGTIGGDFYDACMLDEHHLYFMVGDVSGKGVPAALFMTMAKALSKSAILRDGEDLGRTVTDINAEISGENRAEQLVSALFGVLDVRTGETCLCNAGHENPLVVRSNGTVSEQSMEGGPPLCVMEKYAYLTEMIALSPGDMLVFITDGITEARSPSGDLFGRRRTLLVLGEGPKPMLAADAVRRMIAAARAFEGGEAPRDDVTVLALGFRSKS